MAVIAVYSVKGGVGKTTMATNLAWCSATLSRRETLLWDLDASGGAGFLLGLDEGAKSVATSVFALERDPLKLVRKTAIERLDVLPADETKGALDNQFLDLGKRQRLGRIARTLGKSYERIVFDCPPVLGETSGQVVRAADLVIVPLPPSPLSRRSFDLVVAQVKANTVQHPPILPVLSMLDMRRNLHRAAREENPDWPAIPQASAAEQCAVRRQPLGEFARTSAAAHAFERLWTAIERKLANLR